MKTYLVPFCGGLLAAVAFGQAADRLYDGGLSLRDQKITLKPWGSGGITETKEASFLGEKSVRVSSRNYFQGGTINFNEPRDFSDRYDDKANVLRVTFLLADSGLIQGQTAKGRGNGEANTGLSTVGHAASMNHSKPGDLKINPSIPFKPKIKKIRVVVLTTDGKRSESYVPVYSSVGAGGSWRSAAIPLQSITGLDRTNKTIKALTLSTDTYAILYVGDVRVVSDTTPIDGSIDSAPLNLKWDSEAILTAYGDAGDTPLTYSWDFDDRDGIQVDAEGQQVKYRFRKAGDFKVTLTISDYYGLKKPVKQTLQVKVTT